MQNIFIYIGFIWMILNTASSINLLSRRFVRAWMRRLCSFTGYLRFTLIRTWRFCPFITRRQSRTRDYHIENTKTTGRLLQLYVYITSITKYVSFLHAVSSSESSSFSFFLNVGGRAGPINVCDSILKPKNTNYLITLRSIINKVTL